MKILIRNLSRRTTEEEIRTSFEVFGKVSACDLVLDKNSGKSKGFAFVEMDDHEQGKRAIKALNETEVHNNHIRVKEAQTPAE